MKKISYFKKLLIFGTVISIIPMVFVGSFAYMQSTQLVQERVSKEKMISVNQVRTNVEQQLSTIDQLVNVLVESATMNNTINSSLAAEDFILHRELRKEIANVQSIQTNIEDFVIVDFDNNWLLNNRGMDRIVDEHPDYDIFTELLASPKHTSWQLLSVADFEQPLTTTNCEYTISLVKKLPTMRSHKRTLILVTIPACDLIKPSSEEEPYEDFMILDTNEKIIFHSDIGKIGQSAVETGVIDSVTELENSSGQFDINYNQEDHTVSFTQSDMNQWSFLMLHSIEELREESRSIGFVTIVLTISLIILSLLIILIASKRFYSPIQRLLKYIEGQTKGEKKSEIIRGDFQVIEDQVKSLFSSRKNIENELNEHTKQVRTLFLNRMFLGNIKISEYEEQFNYFKLQTNHWKTHMVITLEIDSLESSNYDQMDWELVTFSAKNIVEETFAEDAHLPAIWIENTLVCLVGFTSEDHRQVEREINELAVYLKNNIDKWLKIKVSIGMSLPYSDIRKSDRAYIEGMKALKNRIRLGQGVIVSYSDINFGKHSIMYDYPCKVEEDLLMAIKIVDEEKVIKSFDLWMEKVFKTNHSIREHQISMMRLLNNLLMINQENNIQLENTQHSQHSYYEEILALSTKENIYRWFVDKLIQPLLKEFAKRRESQFKNLSEKMIDLIHRNYDQDLTLDECALTLHYNANYLSSVFKQETNHTFSEYLTMYRFKKAKQWLTDSDMTVKEIADKLQYNNSQNFIRSFKKYEDITPGQFRKDNRN
ncbi:AraC family transcriptional regulator [Salipaludibacillus sp. HK11]|uniref:AraC family transcriptional regulator n=1 Tax=Salipaludibacillus sp. HK11 TaxID=3394320 RepID=UPI0039FBD658